MGYKSQVAFAVTKDRNEEFLARLSEKARGLISQADTYENGQGVLYHFEWVKWYDGEEIEELIENEFSQDAFFLRLGEEDGDLQEQGEWYRGGEFDLSFTRHIIFSGAPTP